MIKPEYPKLMLVSDNNLFWHKRIVLIHNAKGYIAFTNFEDINDLDKCEGTSKWRYAQDIVEQKIVKTNEGNSSAFNKRRVMDNSSNNSHIYSVEEIYI